MRSSRILLAATLVFSLPGCRIDGSPGLWRLTAVNGVPVFPGAATEEILTLFPDGRFSLPGGTGQYVRKGNDIRLVYDCPDPGHCIGGGLRGSYTPGVIEIHPESTTGGTRRYELLPEL